MHPQLHVQLAAARRRETLRHAAEHRLPVEGAPPPRLDALLGGPRAAILRHLDRPASIGELAGLLFAVPSAATHHTRALEAAGLVYRERRGQRVLVRRTDLGVAVLALYDHVPRADL